ncbi:MAG: hypothetical protein ACLGIO_12895, partial [Acidimicrobiia bacterium]
DDAPPDRWPAVVREELARWVDAEERARAAEAAAWVAGQAGRRDRAVDLAEAFLAALVELPPAALDAVVAGVVGAVAAAGDPAALVRPWSRALARFPVPQWMRLRERFERASAEVGLDAAW